MIGLREFRRVYSGATFLNKIRFLPYELKCAWQRAWRGYDHSDVCRLDDRFIERMRAILTEFKRDNIALWGAMTEEEVDGILDRMIFLINKMNDDACEAEVGGVYEHGEFSIEKYQKAHSLLDSYKDEFFRLFSEYFWCLWI